MGFSTEKASCSKTLSYTPLSIGDENEYLQNHETKRAHALRKVRYMVSKVQMSISDAVLIAEKLQVDYFLQAALKTLIKSKKKKSPHCCLL